LTKPHNCLFFTEHRGSDFGNERQREKKDEKMSAYDSGPENSKGKEKRGKFTKNLTELEIKYSKPTDGK
jgi:hypothetical protein